MDFNRKPSIQEVKLLEFLVKNATLRFPSNWKDELLVRPMKDGGMGSLYLFPKGLVNTNRKLGQRVSEFQFTDVDGVEVIASLNIDDSGNLFELDIWKTDFSSLIKIPEIPQE